MRRAYSYISTGAIADGTIYSDKISDEFVNHNIYIEFYPNDTFTASELVDKSTMTGSVTFTATPSDAQVTGVGEEYLTVANGTLTLGTSDYNPPSAEGRVKRIKVVFNTVVGATHYRLIAHSSES